MRASEMLDDPGFPHGTVGGYRAGCHGSACPALISCATVHTRYAGDWTFRKRVDAGLSLEQLVAADVVDAEAARAAELAAREASREAARLERAEGREPKAVRVPRAAGVKREPRPRVPAPHGTVASYKRGCRRGSECPAEPSCADVYRDVQREAYRLKHPNPKRSRNGVPFRAIGPQQDRFGVEVAHGTVEGYNAGCFTVECPSVPSCADANLAALAGGSVPKVRAVRVRAVSRPRVVAPHGTNASFARGCKVEAECPSFLAGGTSCLEAHKQYHRDYTAKRRAAGVPAEVHGTPYGYQLGCRRREDCPAEVSCSDASLAEERRRRRDAGIPARDLVPAAPVREHIQELHRSLSYVEIARRAGLEYKAVRRLVSGRDDSRRRGEVAQFTERVKADAILAVTV